MKYRLPGILQWSFIDGILLSLVIALSCFLKAHYRTASVDELIWILQPTARVMETVFKIPFIWEKGTGFVNHREMMMIVKSCAGINFLIIGFCMCTFNLIPRVRQRRYKLLALIITGVGMVLITVFVNAARIWISICFSSLISDIRWLTPGQFHRLEGIAVYFMFLWIIYGLIRHRGTIKLLAPFCWYLSITLLIPLINALHHGFHARFVEHAMWVIGVSALMAAVLYSAEFGWGYVIGTFSRNKS